MKILDFNYSLEMGFCYIVVDGEFEGDKMIIQCHLKIDLSKTEWPIRPPKFLEVIERSNCGHDWGICGDLNRGAFKYWGKSRCLNALFDRAKQAGIMLE